MKSNFDGILTKIKNLKLLHSVQFLVQTVFQLFFLNKMIANNYNIVRGQLLYVLSGQMIPCSR